MTSEEIQLQKRNTNIYAYCNWKAGAKSNRGVIMVDVEVVEYNPTTEENTILEKLEMTLIQFVEWLNEDNWMLC